MADSSLPHGLPSSRDLARWSTTLAAIARTGLGFSDNLYERERFEEVLHVAADIKAAAAAIEELTDELAEIERDTDHFVQEWLANTGEGVPGYVTPKVAVGAVVGNEAGEILLVQRADSGVWLYPTGWADVGFSRFGMYMLLFYCRATGGELRPHPLETSDVGWFGRDRLPQRIAGAGLWV